jgi:hypothetical protein
MNVDVNKFVGGYGEDEIANAREEAKALKGAMERLVNNPDFQLIFKHYTEDTVLQEADKAGYAAEHRPMLFESILNKVAFKNYVQELLALDTTEPEENE